MKRLTSLVLAGAALFLPSTAWAASNIEIEQFTHDTLSTLIGVAALAAAFFLIVGGYKYMTSTGNPTALEEAKKTIRRALLGLAIVAGALVFSSLLNTAFTQPATGSLGALPDLKPIEPAAQDGSLIKILLEAISGFIRNIVESATKPILDAITSFLTSTPSLSTNSVVFNFWLVMVGITDSLFALVIALLGFHVMSASTFGFEEISVKEMMPRIVLAFLVANTSIFAIDWIILLCQTLVHAVLNATGGIGDAWISNAFNPATLLSGSTMLITLIFMVVFLVLAAVLLLFYISRLMLLALGAVMSPLICLLWLVPKGTHFAESAIKAYLVTIFSVFIHVVIIQLAAAFLTIPGQVGSNPFIAIFVGIALFSILLKSTSVLIQLTLVGSNTGIFRKFSGQLFNVLSPATAGAGATAAKARRTK